MEQGVTFDDQVAEHAGADIRGPTLKLASNSRIERITNFKQDTRLGPVSKLLKSGHNYSEEAVDSLKPYLGNLFLICENAEQSYVRNRAG